MGTGQGEEVLGADTRWHQGREALLGKEGPPGPDRQYRVLGGSVADLLKSPCKDSKVKRLSRHQKTRNLSRF